MSSTARVHYCYVIGILVGLLILIATDRWTSQQKFTEYLSNAATMTSLVLGLVAIFYSFISNDGLSKSLGNISKVSEDIAATKQSLSSVLAKSTELVESSKSNASELSEISRELENRVESLKETMSEFKSQNDSMRQSFGDIPQRFDQLEAKIGESNSSTTIKQAPTGNDAEVSKLVSKCFEQLTLSAGFALYGAILSFRAENTFSLQDFQKTLNISSPQYMHGVLMTLNAADFIDLTATGVRSVKVTRLNEFYNSISNLEMTKWVTSKTTKFRESEKSIWLARISLAEDFISSSVISDAKS